MSTNIYTIQKSLDSIFGIKFTPSVPNSAFKVSRKQLLLEGKVVLDENGKDTGHNQYGIKHSEERKKLYRIARTRQTADDKHPGAKKAIVTWKGIEYAVDYLRQFVYKHYPEIPFPTLQKIAQRGTYSKKWDVSAKYI
jgi:hypothetical protein